MTDLMHVPQAGVPEHLVGVFSKPYVIVGNERLEQVFDDMVHHLRSEAAGIAMTTIQATLIERIASTFVRIKNAEENPGDLTPTQLRELNKQYGEFIKEFNSLLAANHEQQKAQLIESMSRVIRETIPVISDIPTQRKFSQALAQNFAKIGA